MTALDLNCSKIILRLMTVWSFLRENRPVLELLETGMLIVSQDYSRRISEQF